jgi:hypothetical protein
MTIDPLDNLEAIREVYHGRCPRHVYGFTDNPDTDDQRDDPHVSTLAQELAARAKRIGPILSAFPDSDLLETTSIPQ